MSDIMDTGVKDVLVGTKLFKVLQISGADLKSPSTMSKIKEVATFLNDHPDPVDVLNLVRKNRNLKVSNLDFLLNFVQINREKASHENGIKKLNELLRDYK